mgnify:CR=1 FL=1
MFPSLAGRSNTKRANSAPPLPKSKKGKRAAKSSSLTYKDVVLLPTPDCKNLPTHRTRIILENDGFVVHEFPVDNSWDVRKLKSEIKSMFPVL